MSIGSNVETARKAMNHLLNLTYESRQFFDMLADDVIFEVACPEDAPIYGRKIEGKKAAVRYFSSGSPEQISEVSFERPLEYIADADSERVVVLGAESYTLKQLGERIGPCEFAIILDLHKGLITRYFHIEDMSQFVQAFKQHPDVLAPSWADA